MSVDITFSEFARVIRHRISQVAREEGLEVIPAALRVEEEVTAIIAQFVPQMHNPEPVNSDTSPKLCKFCEREIAQVRAGQGQIWVHLGKSI